MAKNKGANRIRQLSDNAKSINLFILTYKAYTPNDLKPIKYRN
jgi:hypothetical protein